jgi:hypothetical protein
MFGKLKSAYYVCGLDNLYNYVKFCRDDSTGKNKEIVYGVAMKSGRSLPKCIIQDEVENKNLQAMVQGTTKTTSCLLHALVIFFLLSQYDFCN